VDCYHSASPVSAIAAPVPLLPTGLAHSVLAQYQRWAQQSTTPMANSATTSSPGIMGTNEFSAPLRMGTEQHNDTMTGEAESDISSEGFSHVRSHGSWTANAVDDGASKDEKVSNSPIFLEDHDI